MPVSNALPAGGLIYVGSLAASDLGGNVSAQTRGVLDRARSVLASAGSSLESVVSVLVFLRSATDFQTMNDAYRSFWTNDYPTRTTIVTELPTAGASVEMCMVAVPSGSERTVIHPRDWAVSPSPYSYALRAADTVFISGLISRRGRDNAVVNGDVAAQTRVILDNAGELLQAAGLSHANVVSSRVYLPDVASFAAMNDAYRAYFPSAPPARATIQAALAGPQYSVEMTFVASSAPRRSVMEGLPANLNLPLSAAVVAGRRIYLSGALGNDATNRGDAAAQTRATFEKLRRTLAASGASASDVVEALVYVTDLKFGADVDREYRLFFGAHAPARTIVKSGLVAPDGLVEIMLTAHAS